MHLDLLHVIGHVTREATEKALQTLKEKTPESLAFGITLETIRPHHYLGFIGKADMLGKSDPRTQKEKSCFTQQVSASLATLGVSEIIASFSRTVNCSGLDTEGMEFLTSILLAMYAAQIKKPSETTLLHSDNAATVNKTLGKWTSMIWTSICMADVLRVQARQGDTLWVPREQNSEADDRAHQAYTSHVNSRPAQSSSNSLS